MRFLSLANAIHRSSHLDFQMSLLSFEPHVDRQDPFSRALTGDVYTFDDGRTVDLGVPDWRDQVNAGLWTKIGTELLVHEEVARYHSIENNYARIVPWSVPGQNKSHAVRHRLVHELGRPRPEPTAFPVAPEERRKRKPRAKKAVKERRGKAT